MQPKMDSRGVPKLMHTQGSLAGSPYQQKPDLAFITDKRPPTGTLDKAFPDKSQIGAAYKENVSSQQASRTRPSLPVCIVDQEFTESTAELILTQSAQS